MTKFGNARERTAQFVINIGSFLGELSLATCSVSLSGYRVTYWSGMEGSTIPRHNSSLTGDTARHDPSLRVEQLKKSGPRLQSCDLFWDFWHSQRSSIHPSAKKEKAKFPARDRSYQDNTCVCLCPSWDVACELYLMTELCFVMRVSCSETIVQPSDY